MILVTILMSPFLVADPGTWQWLMGLAGPILVGQAIAGLLGLGSLIIVTQRFLKTDFPAAMASVNSRLDAHAKIFERLDLDFRKLILDVTTLSERHVSLRGRVDRLEEREELDDTRSRRRTPRREVDE